MWYLTDKRHLDHITGTGHPERPDRLKAVWKAVESSKFIGKTQPLEYRPAPLEAIHRVHGAAMFAKAQALAKTGGGHLDADTPVCPASPEIALLAAGAACAAVDAVAKPDSNTRRAFCAIRPPGHHATSSKSMGFCIVNSIAVAARHAQARHGIGRVVILDWDVHHGNGTQDIFYEDSSVLFVSIHRYGNGFYPGSGHPSETGSGKGLGTTLNLTAHPGIGKTAYLGLMDRAVEAARRFKPELVLLSAGFDACINDPVGDIGLEPETFGELTKQVLELANDTAEGRVISLLEGGYNLDQLTIAALHHLNKLAS